MKNNESARYWDTRAKKEPYVFGKEPTLVGTMAGEELKKRKLKTILDIGCGYGRDTFYLAKKGFSVTGIDISPQMIEQARQWADEEDLNVNYIVGNFLECNLERAYDAVTSFNFLHLFLEKERRQLAKKMYVAIRSEGLLITSNFSINEPQYGQGKEVEPNTFLNKGRIAHFFTEDEIKDLFSSFNIVSLRKEKFKETHSGKEHYHNEVLLVATRF